MNQLAIKVYKIDYEFIIKNYLDRRLWKQIWNLFIFKDNVFTLMLQSINTQEEKIYFQVGFNKLNNQWKVSKTETILYDLNNMTIELLKKSINGAIFRLAEKLDEYDIENCDIYREIYNSSDEEESILRDVAKDFLDDEGVTNDDIREVYIDYYVDNNKTIYDKLSLLKGTLKYNFQTELLLMICELINDDVRKNKIIINLQNKTKIKELQEEVKKYMEYIETDNWLDEARDNLVAI